MKCADIPPISLFSPSSLATRYCRLISREKERDRERAASYLKFHPREKFFIFDKNRVYVLRMPFAVVSPEEIFSCPMRYLNPVTTRGADLGISERLVNNQQSTRAKINCRDTSDRSARIPVVNFYRVSEKQICTKSILPGSSCLGRDSRAYIAVS